jgi:glycogen synthase
MAMRKRAMAQDFSWDRAAREYELLYQDAYARRRGHAHGARTSAA